MKTKIIEKNIPKGWNSTELGLVSDITMGQSPSSKNYNQNKVGLPFFQGKADFTEDLSVKIRQWTSEVTKESKPGDILMSVRAPVGDVVINNVEACIGRGLAAIRAKKNISEQQFIFQVLQYLKDELNKKAQGSTFTAINGPSLKKIQINLPPLAEQQKIADILSSVDEEIQKVEEIISTTEKLKSGLVEKLFSAASTKIKLSEISSLITKGTTPTTYGHSFIDEGINFFKIENIDESGNIDLSSCKRISEETHQFLKRSQLADGDVLFSIAGALGRIAVIEPFHLPANINQAIAIIRLKDKKDAGFVSKVLKTDYVKKQVVGSSVQLAQANISLGKLGEIMIPWPKVEERQKISSIIQSVDEKVAINKKIRSNLLLLKKGLMNDLLSGKVRTT